MVFKARSVSLRLTMVTGRWEDGEGPTLFFSFLSSHDTPPRATYQNGGRQPRTNQMPRIIRLNINKQVTRNKQIGIFIVWQRGNKV